MNQRTQLAGEHRSEHCGEHHIELPTDAATAMAVVKEVASAWGAQWLPRRNPQSDTEPSAASLTSDETEEGEVEIEPSDDGGRLAIPALAGLRTGEITGQLSVEPARASGMPSGVRLRFTVEEENYHLQPVPVMILCCAAFGCLIVLFWPFFPALASLVPFSIVLGVAAWFLVLAKLSNSGPTEFLDEIALQVETQHSDTDGED